MNKLFWSSKIANCSAKLQKIAKSSDDRSQAQLVALAGHHLTWKLRTWSAGRLSGIVFWSRWYDFVDGRDDERWDALDHRPRIMHLATQFCYATIWCKLEIWIESLNASPFYNSNINYNVSDEISRTSDRRKTPNQSVQAWWQYESAVIHCGSIAKSSLSSGIGRPAGTLSTVFSR